MRAISWGKMSSQLEDTPLATLITFMKLPAVLFVKTLNFDRPFWLFREISNKEHFKERIIHEVHINFGRNSSY
jgi:hypothetical protein